MDIVRFKGGLGNQMFQYAFLESLRSKGRDVFGSSAYYKREYYNKRSFELKRVFPNAQFDEVDEIIIVEIEERLEGLRRNNPDKERLKDEIRSFYWIENEDPVYDSSVFETKDCTFEGYWQTEKYFTNIAAEIRGRYTYSKGEAQLEEIVSEIKEAGDYVSIHIRRGDYLDVPELFGDICTAEYYDKAISFVKDRRGDCRFVILSDDIEWAKEHYDASSFKFIEKESFANYDNWYDMKIMSACRDNIIANSSFSWWGAWLNDDTDKMVVAPKRWFKKYEMRDICPDSWVRI